MEVVFESTLKGKASWWLFEYTIDLFPTYEAIKTAFLQQFHKEKRHLREATIVSHSSKSDSGSKPGATGRAISPAIITGAIATSSSYSTGRATYLIVIRGAAVTSAAATST